ncbi:MAG: T9SS type A sorting domain-containing protein [Flavobacteriales bacterium]|nr:T9SS type A sorting domain-containing protein [Flavobacteriales bacterium]
MDWTALFLGQLACGAPVTCGAIGTGIVQEAGVRTTISPNPTTGPVQMQLTGAARLTLLDASGRVVLNERFGAGTAQVDLSALADGVYTAQLSGTVTETFRIVKAN